MFWVRWGWILAPSSGKITVPTEFRRRGEPRAIQSSLYFCKPHDVNALSEGQCLHQQSGTPHVRPKYLPPHLLKIQEKNGCIICLQVTPKAQGPRNTIPEYR